MPHTKKDYLKHNINLINLFYHYSFRGPVFRSSKLPRSLSSIAEGSQGQEQLHEESRSKEGKTDKSDGPGRKGIVHLETPKHINKQLNLIKGSISIS